MASVLISSLSMSYSVDISNSSFNSTKFSEVDNPFVWNSKEIARLINIIVRPILVVFGTIGNGLSFFIMRRSSLKNLSTCFYMSILALTDTGELFNSFQKCQNKIVHRQITVKDSHVFHVIGTSHRGC